MRVRNFHCAVIALATQFGPGWTLDFATSDVTETALKPTERLSTEKSISEQREQQSKPSDIPVCGQTSGTSDARTIGYYQASSYTRTERQWSPEDIDPKLLTHINYASAVVGEDHRIAATHTFDPELYVRMTELKTRKPALKVFVSVDVSAAGGRLWSDMIQTDTGRTTFVKSAMRFMDTFAFDGIDFFWTRLDEHRATETYIRDSKALVSELRKATYGVKQISLAVPALASSIDLLDLPRMARRVDWLNLMNPLWHSQIDDTVKDDGEQVTSHSNLTESDSVLNQFMQAGIGPGQLVMGIDFYGRSYTIEDPSYHDVIGSTTAWRDSKECLRTSRVLPQAEVMNLLERSGAVPTLNREVAVKQFSWRNQWIHYDDDETIEIKKRFANSRCISGTAAWSIDQDCARPNSSLFSVATKHSMLLKNERWPPRAFVERDVAGHTRIQNEAGTTILLSECAAYPECPAGFHSIGSAYGAWSQFDTFASGCDNPPRRATEFHKREMCIPDNTETHGCTWVGEPPFCGAGCPQGSVQMALNNGPSRTSPSQFCHPYTWSSFCCEEVRLTDAPRSCDDYDLGSAIVHGGGPSAVGADGVALRQALKMAQAGGSNQGLLAPRSRVLEASEVFKNMR